ncbi:hypothetical protein HNR46_004250 [Haloferula luteola]|uniref:Uncharacterized protein n=2 Tax=Haloferula luteola TaxID=595692 RepID=A0A840VJL5_9BACT|nr:hypothetical protein [Haloferula luteola]
MSTKRDWEISAFFDQSVIGVAREFESGWAISGEVMLTRAQAAATTKKNE